MSETARLAALHALDILDGPSEPALDRIAQIVRTEFGARHAGIMMIDRDRGVFAAQDRVAITSLPREETFCNITIQSDDAMIIPDAQLDARIQASPGINKDVRSYAGIPLKTKEGHNIGALCVFDTDVLRFPADKVRKMTELAQLAMDCIELRRLATQDYLTGAMNRRGFMAELDREMRRCTRGRGTLSLAIMDIDHFKRINDGFGHAVGDRVLQEIVALASSHWGQASVVGRLGGEEFGLLLPDQTDASAYSLIEHLRKAIERMDLPGVPDLRVTASFGICEVGPNIEGPADLMAHADTALYRAKASTRNVTVLARHLQ